MRTGSLRLFQNTDTDLGTLKIYFWSHTATQYKWCFEMMMSWTSFWEVSQRWLLQYEYVFTEGSSRKCCWNPCRFGNPCICWSEKSACILSSKLFYNLCGHKQLRFSLCWRSKHNIYFLQKQKTTPLHVDISTVLQGREGYSNFCWISMSVPVRSLLRCAETATFSHLMDSCCCSMLTYTDQDPERWLCTGLRLSWSNMSSHFALDTYGWFQRERSE